MKNRSDFYLHSNKGLLCPLSGKTTHSHQPFGLKDFHHFAKVLITGC